MKEFRLEKKEKSYSVDEFINGEKERNLIKNLKLKSKDIELFNELLKETDVENTDGKIFVKRFMGKIGIEEKTMKNDDMLNGIEELENNEPCCFEEDYLKVIFEVSRREDVFKKVYKEIEIFSLKEKKKNEHLVIDLLDVYENRNHGILALSNSVFSLIKIIEKGYGRKIELNEFEELIDKDLNYSQGVFQEVMKIDDYEKYSGINNFCLENGIGINFDGKNRYSFKGTINELKELKNFIL